MKTKIITNINFKKKIVKLIRNSFGGGKEREKKIQNRVYYQQTLYAPKKNSHKLNSLFIIYFLIELKLARKNI